MTLQDEARANLFVLEEHERQSPLWAKLMAHFDRRIDALRKRNDIDWDAQATARIRGQIAALLELKRLNNPHEQQLLGD